MHTLLKIIRPFLLFLCLIFINQSFAANKVIYPEVIVSGITQDIRIELSPPFSNPLYGEVNGKAFYSEINDGIALIPYQFDKNETIEIEIGSFSHQNTVKPIPLWLSILPPLLAIMLALLFKEVIISLFIGVLSGAMIISCYAQGLYGIPLGLMKSVDTYVMGALNDWGHLAVILFSTLIGGMVAVVSKNGGMQGIVLKLSKYAKNDRSSQLITWLLGVLIFFDDYANTLIVGNTMRPLTDKFKVSREKLSYIVDSTAAPIAAIAFVTTWIGAELGYIQDGIQSISGIHESAYSIFLHSLQYAYYPVLTLIFVFILIWKKVDYGPMLKAERKARQSSEIAHESQRNLEMQAFMPVKGINYHWPNAAAPVLVLILGTIIGIFYTGSLATTEALDSLSFFGKLSKIVGNADSYLALLWSSLLALMVAVIISVGRKIMSITETMESVMNGFKTMLNAVVILVLAWALAMTTEHLHTATFLTGILSDHLSPYLVPALTFILSALVAFSTGSSWGTMAILYPLMLPACWNLSATAGLDPDVSIALFYNVVSTVLAGSVLGDHCSPISDTTILSSLASSCNHIDHVRTQLPYALTVGSVSLLIGVIPASFGIPPILLHLLGVALLIGMISYLGKPNNPEAL